MQLLARRRDASLQLTRIFGTGAAGPVVVSILILAVVVLVFARRLQQGSPITAAEG